MRKFVLLEFVLVLAASGVGGSQTCHTTHCFSFVDCNPPHSGSTCTSCQPDGSVRVCSDKPPNSEGAAPNLEREQPNVPRDGLDRPPPNILFLMADEMDGRIFDPASPQTKPPLPNLNRLAKAGAVFTQAYNQAPQCVPSRSAMLVGLRTDQIGVYDNFVGGVAINGSTTEPDSHCITAFNRSYCIAVAQRQGAPATFVDRVADAGYGIHLFGKMHAGWGLDRFPGSLQEFPFDYPKAGSQGAKELREWTRGIGSETNIKGCKQGQSAEHPPDNKPAPALNVDYQCVDSCVSKLRAGLFNNDSAAQFLYCSIIVPHPPYASNSTYMKAVANLSISRPQLVPKGEAHPNDFTTATLKHLWNTDTFTTADIIYFRRVYFSMCYESDLLLGEILNALDASGARDNTFVLFVSDHGEDNFEHRQLGKNNMYDAASRVAMLLTGPGVSPHQKVTTLASLNDVYPTLLDMAGIASLPSNLAGSSLLPLISHSHSPRVARRDYVIAQYHSVFSVTGSFMIRQGDYKLIEYGPNAHGPSFPPQLFNLRRDPWELHDVAASSADRVRQLSQLLSSELSVTAVDAAAKAVQRKLFLDFAWQGSAKCQASFDEIYGKGSLNATDAARIAEWLGESCPFRPTPGPDPTCANGVKDATGTVCCVASCGVCAHPSSACAVRPGGPEACCPSHVKQAGKSCAKVGAPCVIQSPVA